MNDLQEEIHKEFESTQMFLALRRALWLAIVFEPTREEKSNEIIKVENIMIRKHPQ